MTITTAREDLARLEREYRRHVAEIQADEGFSWEQRERQIRKLGLAFDRARKELEEDAA
jgi:hypothetical protein